MKLPAAYKGTRRHREAPVVASCACGWKSLPVAPAKAEILYQEHIAIRHSAN